MADLISALEEETPVHRPVPRRATIGVAPTASTPAASAPLVPGGRSLTAHALDVKRQIAEFRDAGLDDIADEMEAELKLYVRSMTKMGYDSGTTPPPVNHPQGFFFLDSFRCCDLRQCAQP